MKTKKEVEERLKLITDKQMEIRKDSTINSNDLMMSLNQLELQANEMRWVMSE